MKMILMKKNKKILTNKFYKNGSSSKTNRKRVYLQKIR